MKPTARSPVTRASCTDRVGARTLNVAYRTLQNSETAVKKYRGDVLQLGGSFNSVGNCQTFTSDDATATQGTKGFAQGVNQKIIYGAVWCNRDGALWYLKLNGANGNPPLITELHDSIGSAKADAPQRYSDLEAVAPTS